MFLVSVDNEEGLGVGLFQQVGQFGGLVIGVDREQHGTDLGRGKLKGDPVGDIGVHASTYSLFVTPRAINPLANWSTTRENALNERRKSRST